jgi:triosephosphate isomerase
MRVPLIVGNWKMNTTVIEATELVNKMRPLLDRIHKIEKVICTPFVSLTAVRELIIDSTIKLGAQNVYFEEKGAYTGEISPLMLADLCEFVIIGHSERRKYFHETGEIINKKILITMSVGLKPILCIGERIEENESGLTEKVITEQIASSLARVEYYGDLIIAYEPVWAIGTGRSATGKQANETIGFIRSEIAKLYSEEIAQDTRILYGGSVTADNIAELVREPDIDGALVGGASLKASEFVSIVEQTSRIRGL